LKIGKLLKRAVGRVLLFAFIAYVVWAAWEIARFKRYESTAAAPAATGPALTEVEGAYHMHSKFSDGRKPVEKIAQAAAQAGLDFIILTDHGKPNFKALDAQGRREGVLVLAGSEISTNRGHLIALGFDRPDDSFQFSSDAETAAQEITARGGFSVVAHPYSRVRWSWGGSFNYSGLEIIDAHSLIRSRILHSLPYYLLLLVNPKFALLKMTFSAAPTLARWDQLLAKQPVNGYFSSDAHICYGAIFSVFHLHVLLDQPLPADFAAARREVFSALAKGRFFSAVDGAASSRGFRAAVSDGVLRVSTPYSFAHETFIIHEGKAVRQTTENELALPLTAPGAYRVEVYLRERTPLNPGTPWIISNPVYYEREP